MKSLTDTEVARNFDEVLAYLESTQEEVAVTRNDRIIARIVPEPAEQNALEVFGDLYRTLDEETAEDLSGAITQESWSRRDSIE